MKSKKTKPQAAAPSPQGKAKIEKLRLNKETIKDLGAKDSHHVVGGAAEATITGKTCYCY